MDENEIAISQRSNGVGRDIHLFAPLPPPSGMHEDAFPGLPSKASLMAAFEDASGQSPLESTPGISGDLNDLRVINSTESSDDDDEVDSLSGHESEKSEEDVKLFYSPPVKDLPTGLCYDDRMRYHAEVASTSENDLHPEDPRRIHYIYKELSEAGLVFDPKHPRALVRNPLVMIHAREATEAEIRLVHTQRQYNFVKETAGTNACA